MKRAAKLLCKQAGVEAKPGLDSLTLLLTCAALCGCTNNPYRNEYSDVKVLYTSFDDAPKTLDPAVSYTTDAHVMMANVYEPLFDYHYLKRPYALIPNLAEEVPTPEELANGQVRYRVTLRPDLMFQEDDCFSLSGGRTRAVLAADFAFELMRLADPAVGSPVAEPFSILVGFREFAQRLVERRKDPSFASLSTAQQYAEAKGIEGVSAVDARTLEITLSRPYPQILYWMAMPFAAPMPWEAVQYYDGLNRPRLADHPVGTGPYRITEYERESRIVFEKNPLWYGARHPEWRAPAAVYPSEGAPGDAEAGLLSKGSVGQPLPFIERIEFHRDTERIPEFNKFLQGYYDYSGIVKESFDQVIRSGQLSEDMLSRGMKLAKSISPSVYYIGFNMEDKVVGVPAGVRGRKLRQAMSMAVDIHEYLRLFSNGRGVPAQSPVPPVIFGYEPQYKNPYRQVNLDRARALLEEAGYPGGVDPKTGRPLHLTFDSSDTSPEGRLRFQFFVNGWRQLGLDVEIAATNYNRFQDKMRLGAYQLFLWGWVADYPDPENFMFLLWSQMARSKEGGPNSANYMNPQFDQLFLEMKTMANGPERMALIQKMKAILEEDRPWIELFHVEQFTLVHGWMNNVKPSGLVMPTMKYYNIDPAGRARARRDWNRPILWPLALLAAACALAIVPGVRAYLKERQ